MICEVRNEGKEVALSHVTVGDILALLNVMIHKDREVVFNRPESEDAADAQTIT